MKKYEITVLTALIPPLIIVIGIPNCIFLINKYQQEIKQHGNQAKSLQRVIAKVGNATLMTNVTEKININNKMIAHASEKYPATNPPDAKFPCPTYA